MIATLLPLRLVVAWAEVLRKKGKTGAAPAVIQPAVRRARPASVVHDRVQYMHGRLLLDAHASPGVVEALLAGYSCARQGASAFSFLITQILRGEPTAQTFGVVLDYFADPPRDEESGRLQANERSLPKLLRPHPQARITNTLESRNREVCRLQPAWAWPRAHLGIIAASNQLWAAAAHELAEARRLGDDGDFCRALRAYALARQGRETEAMDELDASALHDSTVAPCSCARIPNGSSDGTALRRLRSDVCLAMDDLEEAVQALEQIRDASPAVLRQWTALTRVRFARLLLQENETAAFAAIADAHWPLDSNCDALADIVAVAFVRHASKCAADRHEARDALRQTAAALSKMPSIRRRPDVAFAHAALLVAARRIEDAGGVLRDVVEAGVADAACIQQYARCCLHTNRIDECEAVRGGLADSDKRKERIAAACNALRGRYEEALRLLDRIGDGAPDHRAALAYLAGHPIPPETLSSAYYEAAAKARSDPRAATGLLGSIPRGNAHHSDARRLNAWIELQDVRALAAGGDLPAAAAKIREAIALLELPMAPLLPHVLPFLIRDDARAAMKVLSSAILCLAIATSDDPYMKQWIRARHRVYQQEPIEANGVGERIVAQLAKSIER